MILGDHTIYDVEEFVDGLKRAMRGIVRVTIGSEEGGSTGYSTGWLITDSLVVVPDFVVSLDPAARSTYVCHHVSRPDEPIPAEVLFAAPGEGEDSRPALLQLATKLRGRALPLESRAPEVGDQVFLLQHPGGEQQPHVSIGRVLHNHPPWLGYDADTLPGSSGAPILSRGWAVVAMHTRATGTDPKSNEGVTIAVLIDGLRESPAWNDIARHHKLADIGAVRRELEVQSREQPTADESLLEAAVRWSFDPKTISEETVVKLRPLVAEASSPRWVLPGAERERLLRSAGSITALREARGTTRETDPRQLVIDRILEGPPYSLDEVGEEVLPHWLQATRWFADVIPSLPTPADVNEELERRRVRSRLAEIGGHGFRGRADELRELREWYEDDDAGPMVITGIGGVGKSALVAHFALGLPDETLLLWLDFDRADVAPDDAASVLRLLFEQMTTQLDGFEAPTVDAASWEDAVNRLGQKLAPHLDGRPAPLVTLDGFEVAQHVKRHREIWRLLEMLLAQMPRLHVLVSGRAPVADVELQGRAARTIDLKGLEDADAEAWLRDEGITDDEVVERVVEITRGIPLVLRLAVRWTEAGGNVDELPEKLPEELVEGFLYRRILDRIIDPLLKPIARDALVLRRLTPAMIPEVLGDAVPEELQDSDVFARLSREMGLVGDESESAQGPGVVVPGVGVLQLRPELRAATLRLLETDPEARARTIDERAAAWYAKQDPDDVTNAAELVYHRLRLNDVEGAAQAWREGCESLLLGAEEELPEDAEAARSWLHDHTVAVRGQPQDLASWESDAHNRIRDVLARGLVRSIESILSERKERTPESLLVPYDAWALWQSGDVEGARALLAEASEAAGPVRRDRLLLAARLAEAAGDRADADRHLARLLDVETWSDRPDPVLDTLTITAARIRLTVDLESELELLAILERQQDPTAASAALEVVLPPSDVVLPLLSGHLGRTAIYKSFAETVRIPLEPFELEGFAFEVDRARGGSRRGGPALALPLVGSPSPDPADAAPWHGTEVALAKETLSAYDVAPEQARALALDLAVLGWRRWRHAAATTFLAQACEQALRLATVVTPQRLSVLATLAAFRSDEKGSFVLFHDKGGPLPEIVDRAAMEHVPTSAPPPTERRVELATRLLESVEATQWAEQLRDAPEKASSMLPQTMRALPPEVRGPLFYLLSPEPLQMLLRQALFVPDSLPL